MTAYPRSFGFYFRFFSNWLTIEYAEE